MNNSIVYVGMDVHKESYTICCYTFDKDKAEYMQKMKADYKNILKPELFISFLYKCGAPHSITIIAI